MVKVIWNKKINGSNIQSNVSTYPKPSSGSNLLSISLCRLSFLCCMSWASVRCLGSVFVKAYQSCKAPIHRLSDLETHLVIGGSRGLCLTSCLGLCRLCGFIFSLKVSFIFGCLLCWCHWWWAKPHHFVASASIGYSGEGGQELLGFFRNSHVVTVRCSVLVNQTKYFFLHCVSLKICLAFLGTGIIAKRVGVVSTSYCWGTVS